MGHFAAPLIFLFFPPPALKLHLFIFLQYRERPLGVAAGRLNRPITRFDRENGHLDLLAHGQKNLYLLLLLLFFFIDNLHV